VEGGESDELRQGLYDIILSDALATRVADLGATHLRAQLDAVDPAELPDRIGEIIVSVCDQPAGTDRRMV
jgi:hypothetical protein